MSTILTGINADIHPISDQTPQSQAPEGAEALRSTPVLYFRIKNFFKTKSS